MKQDRSDWTQQLREKLAEHETAAPEGLWADIEAALPKRPQRARRVAIWRWAAAAAVVLLLGTGAMFWFHDTEDGMPTLQLTANVYEQDVEAETEEPWEEEVKAVEALPIINEPRTTKRRTTTMPTALAERTDDEEPMPTTPIAETTNTENTQHTDSVPPRRKSILPTMDEPLPAYRGKRPARLQPQLSLYAMNTLGSHSASNAVVMAEALARSFDYDDADNPAASRQAPIYLSGYEERSHHRQPVAFGLQAGWPLTPRLTLTTGLVFTRLSAEFTQTMHSQHIGREQTLNYMGVPLGLTYQLWQKGNLGLYMGAVVQADWNTRAKQTTDGVEQHAKRDALQWSANGSLGIQYSLMPQIAVYGETGVNGYFDNGSSVQTFFKERPVSLRLQVGLRFNLHP